MEFSFALAKNLAADRHSGIKLVQRPKHISLPWSFMGKQLRGVKLILDRSLRLYNSELEAIPLAYNQIHRVQKHPYIIEDQPHCHFDVVVEWAVFKPAIGAKLKAEVRQITNPSVVSCLVHGIFNASVFTSQFKEKDKLAVGLIVEFKVDSCEVNRKIVLLRGKMLQIIGSSPKMESQDLSANAENNSALTHVRLDDDSEAKVSKKPTKNKRPPPVEDVEEDMEIVKVKKMKKAKVKSELVEDEEINIQVSLKPKSKKLKAEVKESN